MGGDIGDAFSAIVDFAAVAQGFDVYSAPVIGRTSLSVPEAAGDCVVVMGQNSSC